MEMFIQQAVGSVGLKLRREMWAGHAKFGITLFFCVLISIIKSLRAFEASPCFSNFQSFGEFSLRTFRP